MKLVVDTNILLSALIKESTTREILLSPAHHFYLPEYAFDEINKHFETIRSKSGLSVKELKLVFDLIVDNLEVVPVKEISLRFEEANSALGPVDEKDVPFLALALSIRCDGIWSNDTDLKQQSLIKVWNTSEIVKLYVEPISQPPTIAPAISIIMPIRNEGINARTVVQSAIRKFESSIPDSFEVIVVDDGSTDNTRAYLNKIGDERVTIVGHHVSSGWGGAQIFAFGFSRGETIIFTGDHVEPFPSDIQNYVESLKDVDAAIASKRVPGARLTASVKRNFLSIALNSFVRGLLNLPISDTEASFMVFKRSALEKILPLTSMKRYAFNVELLVLATIICSYKIAELPVQTTLTGFRLRGTMRRLIDIFGIAYRLRVVHWYQWNHEKRYYEFRPILRW